MHNIKSIGKQFPKMLMLLLPLGGAMGQSVRIGSNAQVVESGNVYMTLNNMGIVNDGTFTGNNGSVLKFAGNASSTVASIGGSHAYTLGNLNIAKSSGDVTLNQDVTVNNGLGLVLGNLIVNNRTITLGPTGSITKEDEADRIIGSGGGSIVVTRTFTPGVAQNPGNVGLELTLNGTTGTIIVTRTLGPETLGDGTISSINRAYKVTDGTAGINNYSARFFYFDNELDGNDPSRLNVWNIDLATLTTNMLGKDSNNVTAKWVMLNNIPQPGFFTLGNDPTGIILPGGNSIMHKGDATDNVAAASVKVYPNPVHNSFNMSLTMAHEKDVALRLTDQKGNILQLKKVHCGVGANTIAWDMSSYAAGVYFIAIEGMKNIKIVKE